MKIEEPRDRIILALDVPDADEALALARSVRASVGVFKVGLELFVKCGPPVVERVAQVGKVFLDLKLHDIPATMKGAVASAASDRVGLLTVHASNSAEALREAVSAAGPTAVVGVTVLTSLSQEDLSAMGIGMPLERLAVSRALHCKACGCAGVVCSVHEAEKIRDACGKDFLIVTPGIRPAWGEAAAQDQKRVDTPGEAMRRGADMIVVGRAIRKSADPAGAAARILEEIGG
jgi:orotidine-5'-phosphate decarboxylase